MRSALAAWRAASMLAIAAATPASAAPVAVEVAPDGVDVRISFRLDPRLAGATYGGERWVSPPTYSGASAQDRVEAQAHALDARGKPVEQAFRWIVEDPAMVSVTPGTGRRVTLAVRRAGECRVRVVSARGARELLVRAVRAGEGLRLEIVQRLPPPAPPPTARIETSGRALAEVARERRDAARTSRARGEALLAANRRRDGVVALPSGVQYRVLAPGDGPRPADRDTVTIHYRGALADGTEFVSTWRRGRPATAPLARLVPGLREALKLMPSGARWELVVPSRLAYGRHGTVGKRGGSPLVGPDETLVYEVELLAVGHRAADATALHLSPAGER